MYGTTSQKKEEKANWNYYGNKWSKREKKYEGDEDGKSKPTKQIRLICWKTCRNQKKILYYSKCIIINHRNTYSIEIILHYKNIYT